MVVMVMVVMMMMVMLVMVLVQGDDDIYRCVKFVMMMMMLVMMMVMVMLVMMVMLMVQGDDDIYRCVKLVVMCVFSRSVAPPAPGKADLNSALFLMLTHGRADSGALMMVAWLTCASAGIVLARFFKPLWPNRSVWGQKVWFQGAHPVVGCVVVALAVVQPIMASVRPHPGEPRRSLFNWAHWATGTAARTAAVAAMFLGVDMTSLDLPDGWDKLVLTGAVAWQGHTFKKAVLAVYVAGNLVFLTVYLVAIEQA
ncbi:unnamed protein product [Lampetra fluviatilis]